MLLISKIGKLFFFSCRQNRISGPNSTDYTNVVGHPLEMTAGQLELVWSGNTIPQNTKKSGSLRSADRDLHGTTGKHCNQNQIPGMFLRFPSFIECGTYAVSVVSSTMTCHCVVYSSFCKTTYYVVSLVA